jgi:hypothetical protein
MLEVMKKPSSKIPAYDRTTKAIDAHYVDKRQNAAARARLVAARKARWSVAAATAQAELRKAVAGESATAAGSSAAVVAAPQPAVGSEEQLIGGQLATFQYSGVNPYRRVSFSPAVGQGAGKGGKGGKGKGGGKGTRRSVAGVDEAERQGRSGDGAASCYKPWLAFRSVSLGVLALSNASRRPHRPHRLPWAAGSGWATASQAGRLVSTLQDLAGYRGPPFQ